MTLFPAILAFLCPSVLADIGLGDKLPDSYLKKRSLDGYVIFEWEDGAILMRLYGRRLFLYFKEDQEGDTAICIKIHDKYDSEIIESNKYSEHDISRIAWVTYIYLNGFMSTVDLGFNTITEARFAAERGTPSRVDPYELAIYQTGQMEKSLLLMSQPEFLQTVGKK